MEAEKDEEIKRYDYSLSFYVIYAVVNIVFVALCGYWWLPAIVNLVQVVVVWLEWFRLLLINVSIVFLLVIALVASIYFSFLRNTEENKPYDLYDQYVAAVPTVFRPSPASCYGVTDFGGFDDVYHHNNSTFNDVVPAFQAVEAVRESCSYDRVEMEVNVKKSYRRSRTEKKTEKKARSTVEYRRTESARVTKEASWRSETMDGLNSEEFRMTVETFITQTKTKLFQQNGVVDQWPNGVVDQWQGQSGHYDGSGRHRHRSRRLVDGSGSYLALSN